MRREPWWMMAAVAVLAGCGGSYLYTPDDATVWTDGYPAQVLAVPPEAPQGKVEVTSFGVVEIAPDGAGRIATLHVRLVVTNDGDATPWTLVPSEQVVEIADEGRSVPMYVNTDVPSLPAVTIAQRERRVLDFYYPLPVTIADADNLPGFTFLWQVTTASRTYASRTRFVRVETEPPADLQVVYVTGWGPYWWYDPLYSRVVFVHHVPIHVHGPTHVIVTRPPARHYLPVRDHRRR